MGRNPLYDLRGPENRDRAVTAKALTQTYQERHAVKCDNPYLECAKLFETEKEMKQHKHTEPDHFFCRKCDKLENKKREAAVQAGITCPPKKPGRFDFEDWDAFTVHKVDAMAPFVEGRQKPTDDNPPPHITCEFCGEDFKSFGGRKRHRSQMHPADQDVECPGCKQHFVRAHNMIRHLERNQCPNIRPLEFFRSISQKYVLKQIMEAPHKLLRNLEEDKLSSNDPGAIYDCDDEEDLDEDEGGVAILDEQDEAQLGGYTPLQPEVNLMDLRAQAVPLSNNAAEPWPRRAGKDSPGLASSMRSMSISSTAQSTGATSNSEITARPKGGKQSFKTQGHHVSASKSGDTSVAHSKQGTPSVWTTKASEKLFPYSKETKKDPQMDHWNGILAQRETEAAADDSKNLFKARWWDPTSPDYKLEMFYNRFLNVYLCPFPSCEDNVKFESPPDLHAHMAHSHLRQVFSCLACQKRFYSPSSLVAHAENTRRCYVRDSANFKRFIDEITGGYLKVNDVAIPKIYHTDAIIKKGPQVQGVMETQWSGQDPEDN